MYDPTVREWPLTDDLETVREFAVQDVAGGVTGLADHRVHDSHRNLNSQANAAVDCPFGFTGRPDDRAAGMQNTLNRWYDAKVGRWLEEDPLGLDAGDANVERYVGNSPTNAVDPSGLAEQPPAPPPPTRPPRGYTEPLNNGNRVIWDSRGNPHQVGSDNRVVAPTLVPAEQEPGFKLLGNWIARMGYGWANTIASAFNHLFEKPKKETPPPPPPPSPH